MATDFGNFPIWANNGTLTTPLFIDSGWVCGAVDPNHMNWWYNRTDNALLDLDGRVTTNANNIANLTTTVNNLGNSFEASGLLGVYVNDSSSAISKSYTGASGSPGASSSTVLKTFNHVIQNDGDVHLKVAFEAGIHTSPAVDSTKHFTAVYDISVNGQIVIHGVMGHTHATGSPRLSQVYGAHRAERAINANYNWALIGASPFATFAKNDAVTVTLSAYISAGNKGAISFGIPKLIVEEYRATGI